MYVISIFDKSEAQTFHELEAQISDGDETMTIMMIAEVKPIEFVPEFCRMSIEGSLIK